MTEICDYKQKIKCYVINLDRSLDRLEYITQVFNECGLEFERVAAIDGGLLSEEELKRHNEKSVLPRELIPAEIGCFLSHRECWHRIIESNDQWAAVFEDDIILSQNSGLILQNIDWIPDETDIVKLDTAKIKCTIGHRSSVI